MTTVSRRHFLASGGIGLAALLLDAAPFRVRPATAAGEPLDRLMEGNTRYVASRPAHPNQTAKRRAALARGQRPFATIFGCADSRVPPEVVFDQGLGDLFVVRVAGNVADSPGIASIEYAVSTLECPLVMVLGHSRCGAVDAAVKAAPGATFPGQLGSLVEAIRPAVDRVKDKPGDLLDNAVRANVVVMVEKLRAAPPILAGRVKDGKVRIVGAHYDLETGKVELL
jgi:carbonic anhydrase